MPWYRHCHITFDKLKSNDELFFHRGPRFAAIVAVRNTQQLLRAGVMGFLDPDSIFNTGVDLRDAIESDVTDDYLADLIFVDGNPAEEAFYNTATVPDVRPGNTTSSCLPW